MNIHAAQLDAAVHALVHDISSKPEVVQATYELCRNFVLLLTVIRIWMNEVPALKQGYDRVAGRYPTVAGLIDLYILAKTEEMKNGDEG